MKKILGIFIGTILLVILAGIGLKLYIKKQVREQIDQFVTSRPAIEHLEYERLTTGVLDSKIELQDVTLTISGIKEKLKINRFTVQEFVPSADGSIHLHVDILGFLLKDTYAAALTRLGYTDIALDIRCSFRYDADKKELDLHFLEVESVETAKVNLHLKLNHFDHSHMETIMSNPLAALGFLAGTAIETAQVSYEDHGLAERIFDAQGKIADMSGEEFQRSVVRKMDSLARQEESAFAGEILTGLVEFVENPRSITIRLSPERPAFLGSLLWVRSPGELIGILGVSIAQ
jgi:hypothetical protein